MRMPSLIEDCKLYRCQLTPYIVVIAARDSETARAGFMMFLQSRGHLNASEQTPIVKVCKTVGQSPLMAAVHCG